MSGFVCVFQRDGAPVDPAAFDRMMAHVAHRGPDGRGARVMGSVALGHHQLCTTPESLREHQPLADEQGDVVLVMDGRVDNGPELAATLRGRGVHVRDDTDAEIVLRAYQHWGEGCAREILGDFAFVVWDARRQQVFCARDILGMRPFYYHLDDHVLLCSSEIRPLLEHDRVTGTPNEGMVGEYLSGQITSREETLLRDVTRLHPAHTLTVSRDRASKARYWDVDPDRQLGHRTDAEYAEHLFAVLSEAVKCRMRSHRPIAAMLSGGLDSSAIVAVAQSLRESGRVADVGFEAFGIVFPGRPCDESRYMDDVARTCGIACHHVGEAAAGAVDYAAIAGRYADFPGYPNGFFATDLHAAAAQAGARVLLDGLGGDELFTGSQLHYADLLRRGRLVALLRQIRFDARLEDYRASPLAILRMTIAPLVPQRVARPLRRYRARLRPPWPWLNQEYVRRVQLVERLERPQGQPKFPTLSQDSAYGYLTSGWGAHAHEQHNRLVAESGLESRSPLLDRRVIDFAMALPNEQTWREDRTKFVVRQAMKGRWPESVRERTTKADMGHLFAEALRARGGERLFESLGIEARGWVDARALRDCYRQLMRDMGAETLASSADTWRLWLAFGIETWSRAK